MQKKLIKYQEEAFEAEPFTSVIMIHMGSIRAYGR